jgi:ribosomal protein S10
MAGSTKYDYEALEREYVSGDISIRALAERHGISAFSTVAQQAKKREWDRKRAMFREETSRKQIEQMATARALRLSSLHDSFIDALQAAVYRWAANLSSPEYQIRPAEIATLIDKFLMLSGHSEVTAEPDRTQVGQINIFEGMDGAAFDNLIRLIRPRAALARPVGPDPLPTLEEPRPN